MVLALLLALIGNAAQAREDLAALRHPVWDARLYPELSTTTFYWVDNETVLFKANVDPKPGTTDEMRRRTQSIFLWRLGEDPKLQAPNGDHYCATKGWIRYAIVEGRPQIGQGRVVWMAGPPGQEREVAEEPFKGTANNDRRWIEPADECRRKVEPDMAGHFWVTDPSFRYRLDFGTSLAAVTAHDPDPRPIVLIAGDGASRTSLPVTTADAAPGCTHFHRFDGAFLLWDCRKVVDPDQWRAKNNCWPIWRVEPESGATTARGCLPFGPWVGNAIDIVPARQRLHFVVHGISKGDGKDPGPAGLYRLDEGGAARRILAGFLSNPVVSPDGCRVVAAYTPHHHAMRPGTPGSPTVLAIDLCVTNP